MHPRYHLATDPSNLPLIELKKESGGSCFYDVRGRLSVKEEDGKVTEMKIVNPTNGQDIFFLTHEDKLVPFKGKIIKKLPVEYIKERDVAIPQIKS